MDFHSNIKDLLVFDNNKDIGLFFDLWDNICERCKHTIETTDEIVGEYYGDMFNDLFSLINITKTKKNFENSNNKDIQILISGGLPYFSYGNLRIYSENNLFERFFDVGFKEENNRNTLMDIHSKNITFASLSLLYTNSFPDRNRCKRCGIRKCSIHNYNNWNDEDFCCEECQENMVGEISIVGL
ncbi:hypothetical protein SDC9_170547 [bioreactor metagenome]|uniref:Uncharacterized protein n=1 Tax=bioreactor metagenome TaxID=1076179 RepID=A0A645GAU7_9ZZZZ